MLILSDHGPDKSTRWLCRIRWIAVAGVIISTLFAWKILGLNVRPVPLFGIALLLSASNILYRIYRLYIRRRGEDYTKHHIRRHINIQITTDFVFLTIFLHFSGGIENPLIIFYIFHMIISSILLPKADTYLQTTTGVLLFTSMAVAEATGLIPHYSINQYIQGLLTHDPAYLSGALIIFTLTSYLVVYITSSLAGRLKSTEILLREANADLIEKDQIKNEYVQRVTHDIKGHLAAIQSNISLVEKQMIAPVDPVNLRFIKTAYQRTRKLTDFVNELLMLTNMRLNKRFDTELISLKNTLNHVLLQVKPLACERSVKITEEIKLDRDSFKGIPFSVEEVFSNILHNAVKYTPENGEVWLKAINDGDKAIISIGDTGYGIPEDELPLIFDEFYRASNVKSRIADGTGVGLSLVKAIVERHGGTIRVSSRLNQGSEFTVEFPLED